MEQPLGSLMERAANQLLPMSPTTMSFSRKKPEPVQATR